MIDQVIANITPFEIQQIETISTTENTELYPYLKLFEEQVKNYKEGIFFIDPMGIYVALEDASYMVFHLERLPFADKSIYAISDFKDCALHIYKEGKIFLFFKGIEEIHNIGFRFKSNDFIIRPLLEVSFDRNLRLIQ